MKNKNAAMTFAEILLVVGIIGTIAMLSLPGLKKHSQMTEMGRLAQKAYLTVEEAVDNAILTHGSMKKWDFSDNAYFCKTYIAPNVKNVEVKCDTPGTDDKCNNYVVLQNGIKLCVAECQGAYCHIHADVNGDKLPNKSGKDFFEYAVYKDGYTNKQGELMEGQNVIPHCPTDKWLRANNFRFTEKVWNCNNAACGDICGESYPNY